VILVVVLLGAGLYIGTLMHNVWFGDAWTHAVARCEVPAGTQPAHPQSVLDRQKRVEDCLAPAERRRAGVALSGAAVAGLGGVVVMYASSRIVTWRHRLRRLDARFVRTSARIAELSTQIGLRRPPILMMGSLSSRETSFQLTFAYGAPGRYRVALAPKLAVMPDSDVFRVVVLHELAHIVHRDVALSWLARSTWYVLFPLFVLPPGVWLLQGDLSLLSDYLWRTALLAAAVSLARSAALRTREFDADLRAVQASGDTTTLVRHLKASGPILASTPLPRFRLHLSRSLPAPARLNGGSSPRLESHS
jgi:Zn-dependent protease with chaperone function